MLYRIENCENSRVLVQKRLTLVVFSDGAQHCEPVTTDQTVNTEQYCDVLKRPRENIQHKHPALWGNSLGSPDMQLLYSVLYWDTITVWSIS